MGKCTFANESVQSMRWNSDFIMIVIFRNGGVETKSYTFNRKLQ